VAESWNLRAGLASGTWVTISGTNLASGELSWAPSAGRRLETTLGGVKVKVNNVDAPLAFVSPTRITLLVPAGTPEGDVPVVVERDGQASQAVVVKAAPALPAIRGVADPNNAGRVYASVGAAGAGALLGFVNPRGWILGKPDLDSRASRGAYPGEEIDIFATGLGKTDGDLITDRLTFAALNVAGAVNVRFGEQSVAATAAALVAPGVYAVRVKVPEGLEAGEVALVVEANGASSGPNVLLNITKLP